MLFALALALTAAFQRSDSTLPLVALRVREPVRVDGVLDEPAWMRADSLIELHQKDPVEGAPATQRTVVRVLAAEGGLYVGAWMYDDRPAGLVRAHLRRDDAIESDD